MNQIRFRLGSSQRSPGPGP